MKVMHNILQQSNTLGEIRNSIIAAEIDCCKPWSSCGELASKESTAGKAVQHADSHTLQHKLTAMLHLNKSQIGWDTNNGNTST